MRCRSISVLALWLACACGTSVAGDARRLQGCEVVQLPRPLPPKLTESSGIAAGKEPDLFWTFNDSGNDATVYAVGAGGAGRGWVEVAGAKNNDWEDIARGPCPAGTCLYIADIGDNDAKRGDVELYRIPEPAPGDAETGSAESFRIRYPGGPRDAEALFILPSGELYVIAKGRDHPITIFRYPLPLRPGETVELERVRELSAAPVPRDNQITAAAASPDGRWVALRSYTELFVFRTGDLLTPNGDPEPALRVDLRPLGEAQGEGIALTSDAEVVLTSEGGVRGASGTIARLRCTLPSGEE